MLSVDFRIHVSNVTIAILLRARSNLGTGFYAPNSKTTVIQTKHGATTLIRIARVYFILLSKHRRNSMNAVLISIQQVNKLRNKTHLNLSAITARKSVGSSWVVQIYNMMFQLAFSHFWFLLFDRAESTGRISESYPDPVHFLYEICLCQTLSSSVVSLLYWS